MTDRRAVTTAIFALVLAAGALQGCAAEPFREETPHASVRSASTGAQFDVEVRYAGGLTRADAEALLARIEIVPADELFPGADLSAMGNRTSDESAEPLDDSEPTFDVRLRPLDDAARDRLHGWRVRPEETRSSAEGRIGTSQQALSADTAVGVYLDPGERWRTSRQYCHAFGFVASVAGIADVCIDLGYDGVAGHQCTFAYDPREPIVLFHPGPNLNPFDKHYFRGRVTGKTFFGVSMPTVIAAAGYACL